MTEDFLHYIWKFQNFEKTALLGTRGEAVHIAQSGFHNHHAGPDFLNARILIDTELWAGNVEIHIRSSDWDKHKHQHDAAYNNVILHVVYEHDVDITNEKGERIPTIELKGRFDEYLYWRYEQLVQNTGSIPCEHHFGQIENLPKESMLERVLAERVSRKAEEVLSLLKENNGDWEETAYQWLAYCFGLKINAEPMLWLAKNLPLKRVQQHRHEPSIVQALVFGAAGFLQQKCEDTFTQKLKADYEFFNHKYQLKTLDGVVWNYGRLRPTSFPEKRLAHWSALLSNRKHLFTTLLETGDVNALFQFFDVPVHPYWNTHYRMHKESKAHSNKLSKAFVERLIINGTVPFLFAYGQHINEDFYKQRAIDLLDQLPPESNKIVDVFEQLGFKLPSAFYTQSAIELKHHYCDLKKCLNCTIGNHILKKQA